MELTVKIIQILQGLEGAAIIEGAKPEYYDALVKDFKHKFSYPHSSRFDFFDLVRLGIEDAEELDYKASTFVYNADLFADDLNPKEATDIFAALRGKIKTKLERQYILARPGANLDFNSRPGYTFHDNHPLGNGFEFYRIEDGEVVPHRHPIQHQD
jgi:hypothetical protein